MQQSFEKQAREAAASLVNILTAITPVFLVVTILGIALLNGYLEYLHYFAVIGSAAWVPGFIFASIRFGSGLGGIHLFKSGQIMRGIFFLAVSVGLTFWASAHSASMAQSIAISQLQIENARVLILTGLWVALIGELMIATYMGATQRHSATETSETPGRSETQNIATLHRSNGEAFATPQPRNVTGGSNGAAWKNATTQHGAQQATEQRGPIGFRRAVSESHSAVSNGVTAAQRPTVKEDAQLVAEQLETAKNNLRAFRSKLKNGKGNAETLQAGVQRWETKVTQLETQLQQLQD